MRKVITMLNEMKECTTDFYISEYLDALYDFTLEKGYEIIALYEEGDKGKSLKISCNKPKFGFTFEVKFFYSDDAKPCYIIPTPRLDCGVRINLDWADTDDFINAIYQAIGKYFDSIIS